MSATTTAAAEADPFRRPIETLIRCGARLGANSETICQSCQFLHRFRRYFDHNRYDLYLMAATALYLAAKVTETHLKLRDVIQVFYQTVHKTGDELRDLKIYQSLKDSIIDCELLLLRMLRFKVNTQLPHRYLNLYLQTLNAWISDENTSQRLDTTAWALVNDYTCISGRSLDYRPQHIAIAVIELSLRCLNYKIPYNEEALISWHEAFDDRLKKDDIEEVVQQITSLYTHDSSGGDGQSGSSGIGAPQRHSFDTHFNYTPHGIYDYRSQKSSH